MLIRLDEDEWYDEVHITTVPRFKTSELSGDEWRYSIHVELLRKGRVMAERDWNRLEWALAGLQGWMLKLGDKGVEVHATDDLCMQPGCSKPYTVEYRMTRRGCGHCGNIHRYAGDDYRRRFCDKHKRRGDSDLDDMDLIYEG